MTVKNGILEAGSPNMGSAALRNYIMRYGIEWPSFRPAKAFCRYSYGNDLRRRNKRDDAKEILIGSKTFLTNDVLRHHWKTHPRCAPGTALTKAPYTLRNFICFTWSSLPSLPTCTFIEHSHLTGATDQRSDLRVQHSYSLAKLQDHRQTFSLHGIKKESSEDLAAPLSLKTELDSLSYVARVSTSA